MNQPRFKEGQTVWVAMNNLHQNQPAIKQTQIQQAIETSAFGKPALAYWMTDDQKQFDMGILGFLIQEDCIFDNPFLCALSLLDDKTLNSELGRRMVSAAHSNGENLFVSKYSQGQHVFFIGPDEHIHPATVQAVELKNLFPINGGKPKILFRYLLLTESKDEYLMPEGPAISDKYENLIAQLHFEQDQVDAEIARLEGRPTLADITESYVDQLYAGDFA